jgi:ribosomal protein S18 acetylase RimI-like enzyme
MASALSILAMAAAYVQQSEAMEFKEDAPRFGVRSARSSDVPLLERVEKSAAEAFRTVGMDFLLDEPTVEVSVLTRMARANHLWIAVNDWDQPIGFLGGEDLSGNFHITEISVAQDYQGRGIGGVLMRTMFEQIQREGYKYITLTTFKDVPWNGPVSSPCVPISDLNF